MKAMKRTKLKVSILVSRVIFLEGIREEEKITIEDLKKRKDIMFVPFKV